MPMYRVYREENVIRLFRLNTDAAGNHRWTLDVTLRPDDVVETDEGFARAADLDDQTLVRAVVGGKE